MTASRSLDESTAAVVRQALAAAQVGRIDEACITAERGLASGSDPVVLNALLGTLRLRSGELERAVGHLEFAHELRPGDVKIATSLANALVGLERYDRAFEVARSELAFNDPSLQLARVRGYVADQLLDFEAAVEALEHVVSADPLDWESWNNLGNARRGALDLEGSVEAFRRSVDLNPLAPPSRLNYAAALRDAGHIEEAEAAFRQMAADFPEDAKPLSQLHLLFKNLGRDEEAIEAVEAAIAREPANVELLLARASHLSLLHKMEASEAAYRRVLEIDPVNAIAYLGLAVVYEMNNRPEALAPLAEEAEERGVSDTAIKFIRAYHYRRTKQYEAGLAALEDIPSDLEAARRYNLLGQLLDGAGRYDEAFEAFSRMNEILSDDPTKPEERGAHYRNTIRQARETVTEDWVGRWREECVPDSRPAPVFLVGFPRSGTTLLDTILMSHPQIEVLEEEPTLHKAQDLLMNFNALPTAGDEQIKAAREVYFETAASVTPLAPGKLLVDKNPLGMNQLPHIRRLFPEARVILALRHPCDVVLSCFIANFRLNDGMASFLRLDTAAELYDLSFSYYEHVQQLMPLPTHVVMYENIVADRGRELRGLFDFLGLDWHDAVMDHQKTALSRGRIKTASYAQVVEPIYTRSAGRWQRYRKHLEPILPMLEPWAKKFGYTIDES
jgi:tetratricopeptide (TPR) repeat protein